MSSITHSNINPPSPYSHLQNLQPKTEDSETFYVLAGDDLSPLRAIVSDPEDLLQLRNAIAANLIARFHKKKIPPTLMSAIRQALETTNINNLIFYLHGSKADYELKAYQVWQHIFEMNFSIDEHKEDSKNVEQALSHPKVVAALVEVVNAVLPGTAKEEITKHLKDIQVSFFTATPQNHSEGIRGFAGHRGPLINRSQIIAEARSNLLGHSVRIKKAVFAELALVAIHETAHVLLRRISADMNFSTPTKLSKAASEQPAGPESGRIVEFVLFGCLPQAVDPDIPEKWLDQVGLLVNKSSTPNLILVEGPVRNPEDEDTMAFSWRRIRRLNYR